MAYYIGSSSPFNVTLSRILQKFVLNFLSAMQAMPTMICSATTVGAKCRAAPKTVVKSECLFSQKFVRVYLYP